MSVTVEISMKKGMLHSFSLNRHRKTEITSKETIELNMKKAWIWCQNPKYFRFELEVTIRSNIKKPFEIVFDSMEVKFRRFKNEYSKVRPKNLKKRISFLRKGEEKQFVVAFFIHDNIIMRGYRAERDTEIFLELETPHFENFTSNVIKIETTEEKVKIQKFKEEFSKFEKEDKESFENLEKNVNITLLKENEKELFERKFQKVDILMKKGRYPTKVIPSMMEGYDILFTFPITFMFEKTIVRFGQIIYLYLIFCDKDHKVFLKKKLKFNTKDFKETVVVKKNVEIRNVDIIFQNFPIFIRVFSEEKKIFSNSLILKKIEYFGNLSNVKYEKHLPSLLKELREKKFKVQKGKEEGVRKIEKLTYEDLPFEVHYEMFSFLSVSSLFKIQAVSKYYQKVSNYTLEFVIQNQMINLGGISKKLSEFIYRQNERSWKRSFIYLMKLSKYLPYSNVGLNTINKIPTHEESLKNAKELKKKDVEYQDPMVYWNSWLDKDTYDDAGPCIVTRRVW